MGDNLNVAVPSLSGSATGNPQNKVALKKGRGLMDWVRLGNGEEDLAGTGGKVISVTTEELAKHNKRNDAWMALRGKVYNVTPYFEYHPGGEDELLRGVGVDATDLFNEVHKWVNFETMLKKCFIGQYVETRSFFSKPKFLPLSKKKEEGLQPPQQGSVSKLRNASPLSPVCLPAPKFDWFQTKTLLNITIHSKWKELTKSHVIVINHCRVFKMFIYIQNQIYIVNLELLHPIESEFELKVFKGKVDILMKKELHVNWPSVGKKQLQNNKLIPIKDITVEYFTLKICKKEQITHDTYLFTLESPSNIHFCVPIGFHVFIKLPNSDIVKPYTPILYPFIVPVEEGMHEQLQLFIKIYPDGALTPLLNDLTVGDDLDVSLPQGSFSMGNLKQATVDCAYLVLLGAGTGITPLLKLLLEALDNSIPTRLVLFNKNEVDIPWRSSLDQLMQSNSNILKITHILSAPSDEWEGPKGLVKKEMLDKLLPISDGTKEAYICLCGSKTFSDLALGYLKELGYKTAQIHVFTG